MSPKKLAEYETECINVTYFKVFWLIPAALCWGCYNTTHLSLLSCTHPPHQPLMQFVVSKISTPSKNTSLCLISLWHKDSLWHFCEGHFSKSKPKTKIYCLHVYKSHCIPITRSSLVLCVRRARWSYAEHTEASEAPRAWPWLLLSIRVWASEQDADAYPSPTRSTLDTSRHLNVHLHQNDVNTRERRLNGRWQAD